MSRRFRRRVLSPVGLRTIRLLHTRKTKTMKRGGGTCVKMVNKNAKKETELPPRPCPTPYLLFQDIPNRESQIFCNSFLFKKRQSIKKSIPELCGKQIIACRQGWAFLHDLRTQTHWWLWNPVSNELIELPNLELSWNGFTCTLTAPPHGETECIVLICMGESAMFCRPWEEHWTKQVIGFQPSDLAISDGMIYGLCLDDLRLYVMEVDAASMSIRTRLLVENLQTLVARDTNLDYYFLESCGQLVVVLIYYLPSSESYAALDRVIVLKLDMERMAWTEAKNLNDHAIFLGQDCSFSCPDPGSGSAEKNCMYFRFDGDEAVQCYGMEDKSVTVLLPCERYLLTMWTAWWILLSPWLAQQYEGQEEEKLPLGTGFERLPNDMIESIASRLKITDYLSFHRACQKICSGALLPITKHLKNHTASSPWLMFCKNNQSTWNLVDPINDSFHFMNILPHLEGGEIQFSSRDGLIMCKSEGFHYYNPFSTANGELPPVNGDVLPFQNMGFSSFPNSSDAVTVGILGVHGGFYIYCFYSDNKKWIVSSLKSSTDFCLGFNSPIYLDGEFYFVDQFRRVGRLRFLENRKIKWAVSSRSPRIHKPFCANYLVECHRRLYSVELSNHRRKVRVFAIVSGEQYRVYSLKGHTFFVSRRSSFGIIAPVPCMANRIYFPRFRGEDLVYYSLNTKKFHVVGSDEATDDLYFSKEMLNAIWVFPSW